MFFVFPTYRNRGVIFFMEISTNSKFIMVILRISADPNWFDFLLKFLSLPIASLDDDGRPEKNADWKDTIILSFTSQHLALRSKNYNYLIWKGQTGQSWWWAHQRSWILHRPRECGGKPWWHRQCYQVKNWQVPC